MAKVCGVGLNDMKGRWYCGDKPSTSQERYNRRVYQLWRDMIRRCYSNSSLVNNPSYLGCTVCDRWKIFSNFIKDLPFIPGYRRWLDKTGIKAWFLDKDSKYPGNRVYDPSTVIFISNSQSSREVTKRTNCKGAISAHQKALQNQSYTKAHQKALQNKTYLVAIESRKRITLADVNGVIIEANSLKEMSQILQINYSTIRSWVQGKGRNKYNVRYKD